MSKLEELLKSSGANIDASMGAGRIARPLHGATPSSSSGGQGRMQGIVRSKDAAEIPVDRIDRDPEQPREEFGGDGLERLAQSLRTRGQLQPIRVWWDEGRGTYIIVCGERRWRAAKLIGLPTLSCVIMERPTGPGELLALQLIENALREDLSAMEQARAYKAITELNGWSARHLAAELAINPATVTRALALLELPAPIQDQVEQGALPPATAYEVSKLEDPAEQADVVARVVAEGLSRAETIKAVRRVASKPRASNSKEKGRGSKAKPKLVTVETIKAQDGYKITIERKKGIDPQGMVDALRIAQERAESAIRIGQIEEDAA